MAGAFLDSLDIANRACDHCGVPHIKTVDEDSRRNEIISGVYDKLRQAELRRNVWKFSKRQAILRAIAPSTRILNPADWNTTTVYLPGSIVKHSNDQFWISPIHDNQGNEPGVSAAWDHYLGPVTVSKYVAATDYYQGELVYVEAAAGSFIVYASLANANSDVPTTATAWDEEETYKLNDRVSHSGSVWRSIIVLNTGNEPTVNVAEWSAETEYSLGEQVTASDGFAWQSDTNGNIGNDPVLGVDWTKVDPPAPAAWEAVPELQAASANWLPVFSGLRNVDYDYLGMSLTESGSSLVSGLRNIFHVPSGFLRLTINRRYPVAFDDYTMAGNYIVAMGPILFLTFSADITDVRKMDTMFCEGLGARIGLEVCEPLTQSNGKMQTIVAKYKQFMTEARIVNAIEVGPEEADIDDFISVRD